MHRYRKITYRFGIVPKFVWLSHGLRAGVMGRCDDPLCSVCHCWASRILPVFVCVRSVCSVCRWKARGYRWRHGFETTKPMTEVEIPPPPGRARTSSLKDLCRSMACLQPVWNSCFVSESCFTSLLPYMTEHVRSRPFAGNERAPAGRGLV